MHLIGNFINFPSEVKPAEFGSNEAFPAGCKVIMSFRISGISRLFFALKYCMIELIFSEI